MKIHESKKEEQRNIKLIKTGIADEAKSDEFGIQW